MHSNGTLPLDTPLDAPLDTRCGYVLTIKVCSHVTEFGPSPIFGLKLFYIHRPQRSCFYTCLSFCSQRGDLAYPPGQTPPLHSACWDTVNKRAVCILLECNLVENIISIKWACHPFSPKKWREIKSIYFL